MDSSAYTAALVQSLVDFVVGIAWPGAALIVVATFRHQIRALLDRVKEAEGFGLKATFDPRTVEADVVSAQSQALAQVREIVVRDSITMSDSAVVTRPPLVERLADLANTDPLAAVLAAYEEVEGALRQRMRDANLPEDRSGGYLLLDVALRLGAINPETHRALRGLLVLKVLAEKGDSPDISTTKAIDYLALCDAVIYTIQTWTPKQP